MSQDENTNKMPTATIIAACIAAAGAITVAIINIIASMSNVSNASAKDNYKPVIQDVPTSIPSPSFLPTSAPPPTQTSNVPTVTLAPSPSPLPLPTPADFISSSLGVRRMAGLLAENFSLMDGASWTGLAPSSVPKMIEIRCMLAGEKINDKPPRISLIVYNNQKQVLNISAFSENNGKVIIHEGVSTFMVDAGETMNLTAKIKEVDAITTRAEMAELRVVSP